SVVLLSPCTCRYSKWDPWSADDSREVSRRIARRRIEHLTLSDERKELAEKIRWLLLLRVVILSFFLGATAVFHFFGTAGDISYLFGLSVPLIIAYTISIGSAIIFPRIHDLRPFAHAQIWFDVLLITGIIWITGDFASPFPFLYNLAVMNGAILLFYRVSFLTAGCSSFCFLAMLVWSRYPNAVNGLALTWSTLMPIALSIGSFFVIAWLSGFLTNKLSETEKLLKEKQIDFQELDAFKDALLQGIGSGVAITDSEGRINYFNQQAQSLTSLNEAAVMGKPFNEIFPGLKFDFHRNDRLSAVFNQELPLSGLQGLQKQMRLTLTPLSDSKELLLGYVYRVEDITKQKQIEEKVRIEEELRRSRECDLQVPSKGNLDAPFRFDGVVGKSGGIGKIYQLIQKVSASNTNVLISGESGTGKELVARAIHLNGPR